MQHPKMKADGTFEKNYAEKVMSTKLF